MKNFSLFEKEERIECKPFIKWVGGKGQLLPEINKLYPIEYRYFNKIFKRNGRRVYFFG